MGVIINMMMVSYCPLTTPSERKLPSENLELSLSLILILLGPLSPGRGARKEMKEAGSLSRGRL